MSGPPKKQHRELIELAALFAAAGLTDIFTDVLGHRIEGPSVLVALGVVVAVVVFARHRPGRGGRGGAGAQVGGEGGGGSGGALVRGSSMTLSDRVGGLAGSSSQLWRVRTMVGDTPGRLAVLAGAFAAVGANILTLEIHPVDDGVVDEFLVQAEAEVTPQRLGAAVAAAGGGQVHVEGADVTALADVPTRALALARHLADGPEQLGRVLVELLGATDVVWRSSGDVAIGASHGGIENESESGRDGGRGGGSQSERASGGGSQRGSASGGGSQSGGVSQSESVAISVSWPRAGVMVVSRAQVPFTFVEVARAQAMADLAGALYRVDAPSCS